MSGSTLNKEILLVDNMKRETGVKTYPIWLLFNPKHPAVRHYIWTPVLAVIQDKVYRKLRTRIDTSKIYIRNVISDGRLVPNTLNWWDTNVIAEIHQFRDIVLEYEPKILISFGAFPYEFVRRAYAMKPEKGPKSWGTANLGDEFVKSIENFDINKTNIFPLLRRVVSSDKFIEDPCYSDNYFHYVGSLMADKIIENRDCLNIWMD